MAKPLCNTGHEPAAAGRSVWRVLVMLLALVSVVALYSHKATQFHQSIKSAQIYPKYEVEKPAVLGQFSSVPGSLAVVAVCHYALIPYPENSTSRVTPAPRPPSRAPPTPSAIV
ncbi:MAG: hypothetical protein ACM3ZT_10410 [Bacillota bacterium]